MILNDSYLNRFALIAGLILILFPAVLLAETEKIKAASGGEITFTVRTVTQNGNYAPKHVFVIWVEDANGFVKTRKLRGNQRKQYLYTWKDASDYNVVDAITGSTLTSHQTHSVTWDCTDLDGEIVPDGDYVVWVEFTEKHAQGPLYNITFTKGPDAQSFTPADESYFKDIELEFIPFVADFTSSAVEICQMESITYSDESVNATSWEWNFGDGANPASSSSQGPHTVSYSTSGTKTVTLSINGSLTETKENYVNVIPQPEAGFTFAGSDLTVEFTNSTTNATDYSWDFGDGNNSTETSPIHTYATAGTYTVTLSANNLDCENTNSQDVSVPLTGINNIIADNDFEIYPNPNNGVFEVQLQNNYKPEIIQVIDQSGKTIKTLDPPESKTSIITVDIGDIESGIYFMLMVSQGKTMSKKIIIK